MKVILILGNQLFDPSFFQKKFPQGVRQVFMREDRELCTYFKFHQQKIVFFLAAMRTYRDELEKAGFQVHYEKLGEGETSYEKSLATYCKKNTVKEVHGFSVEDRFFEKRLGDFFTQQKINWVIAENPMFLASRTYFKNYLSTKNKPFMKTYYEAERKRLKILMNSDGTPEGGKFSFDEDNRERLPKNKLPPDLTHTLPTKHVEDVIQSVQKNFSEHPGQAKEFWLPVDRGSARAWCEKFFRERLEEFGTYEDSLSPHSTFVFHSVLTPFLNTGLLTPREVIKAALDYSKKHPVRLASLEGFIRQIVGWREFIHGIDQNFGEQQAKANFWKHHHQLRDCWYDGTTGVPPLDEAIRKASRFGYAHHIERLMVIGNFMLLTEVEPKAAHAWFMEMFIDSSDWVMGPNVYGMGIFSDGGIFATKPYICGSNYYRKMGGFAPGDWCDGVDGLYWGFIEKHQSFFLKNPRLSMIARGASRMSPERRSKIKKAAEELKLRLVKTGS